MAATSTHPRLRLPALPHLSRLGRALAGLQVAKETLTIVFLGLPLLWEAPLLAPAALPGLVLYWLRWRMAFLNDLPRRAALVVWALTLVDELWGLVLFLRFNANPTAREMWLLRWSYGLGLGLTLAALAELGWHRAQKKAKLRALLRRT